jgi:type IV secretory pathway protease TraF
MTVTTQRLEVEIREQLNQLPLEQQQRVLEFARSLAASQPQDASGRALLRFAGAIEPTELESMQRAIEEACETVDYREW